jgi:hypothetical protein
MSKRHQASRRRAYGRRQHEIRERQTRQPDNADLALDAASWRDHDESFGRLEVEFGASFRFAVPD